MAETTDKTSEPKGKAVVKKGKEQTKTKISTKCSLCGVTSCPMWRPLPGTGGLCCNICHLKKTNKILNSQPKNKEKPKESTTVTRSGRKGRNSKYKNGSVKNNDKVSKLPTIRSRRSKFKRKPARGGEGVATIVTSNKICHKYEAKHFLGVLVNRATETKATALTDPICKDIMYHCGDIVAVTDFDGSIYYAQLCGLLQNDYGEKYGVITWLLPLVPSPRQFEPSLFVPGPVEDVPRPMECLEFVCRAPNDFFKWRSSSISRTKTTADLLSLVTSANLLLGDEVPDKDVL